LDLAGIGSADLDRAVHPLLLEPSPLLIADHHGARWSCRPGRAGRCACPSAPGDRGTASEIHHDGSNGPVDEEVQNGEEDDLQDREDEGGHR
jgi:hypothetical protein